MDEKRKDAIKASGLSYTNQNLPFEEQSAAGFYGENGWEREPITNNLGVTGEQIGAIFPPVNDSLCMTVRDGQTPIGHCNVNSWRKYLSGITETLKKIENDPHAGLQTFRSLLLAVTEREFELKKYLVDVKGIDFSKIAHRCGLMILSDYSGRSIGTEIAARSDRLLCQKGYKVVVVKTTNVGSRRVYEKLGYTEYESFDLPKHNIPINDRYSILYKIY